MQIKVCGMRDPDNIEELVRHIQPDWMGLIFYEKSPRFVLDTDAVSLWDLPQKKVGVFVNEKAEIILQKVEKFKLQVIQLHGDERPEFLKELTERTNCELWKVISIQDQLDWESLKAYLPYVSKFLFDTKTPAYGGSGVKFDWSILESYPFEKDYLLSGGLDEDSADEILALAQKSSKLAGVDLNSRFELEPGNKDIQKLVRFLKKLRAK